MNSGIQKIWILNLCPNKCKWILLSAILLSVAFMACSPRSVRNGKTRNLHHPVKEKVVEAENISKAGNIESREFLEAQQELLSEINRQNTNKSDTFYLDEKSGEVLPYNSHLRAIMEEQDNINRKVSSLQSDVGDIKSTLELIKSELLGMNNKPQADAVAGETSYENPAQVNKSNTMLPDEKVNTKSEKKQNTPQKKAVKPKTRVNASNKKKTVDEPEDEEPVDFSSNDNTVESGAQTGNDNFSGFNKAMNEFKNRNYKGAINELHNMLKKEKNKDNVGKLNYWIGESHFGLNQYDKAVNYFEKVLSSNNNAKKDDAQIMIAESHARTGNIEEARKAFSDLISNYPKSRYIPRARKMLQQL